MHFIFSGLCRVLPDILFITSVQVEDLQIIM